MLIEVKSMVEIALNESIYSISCTNLDEFEPSVYDLEVRDLELRATDIHPRQDLRN